MATATPEFVIPALAQPVGGPLTPGGDVHCDLDRLFADMRTAWHFAERNYLAVLTIAADRNGAYMVVSPTARLAPIFGAECGLLRSEPPQNGVVVEHWLGCIGHIRVFWREVKCAH